MDYFVYFKSEVLGRWFHIFFFPKLVGSVSLRTGERVVGGKFSRFLPGSIEKSYLRQLRGRILLSFWWLKTIGFGGGLFLLFKKPSPSLKYLTQEIKLCVVRFNVVSDRQILSSWQLLHKHLLWLR